jgi:hypothetical protein
MPLTVAETVIELERLKHQRAVWMEIVEHLSKTVDKESKNADHGIQAEDCIASVVPQEVVKEFIELINDEEIEPLNQEIGSLENLNVEEEKDGPKGDPDKKKGTKKKKGPNKKSGTQGGSQKKGVPARLRKVPRTPGRKAQGIG